MRALSQIFKVALFAVIIVALYLEIFINGTIIIGAFYYFTVQSNLLVAFCLLLFVFIPRISRGKCLLRGVSLLAITITGIIYNFVLYRIFLDWGTVGYTFSRTITHVVAPLGFILDWLIFDKHNMMKWKDIFIWLVYPAVYCLFALYMGFRYDIYLYFFLDVSNGYSNMVKWGLILLVALFMVASLFVVLDKYIGRRPLQSVKSVSN